MTDTGRVPILKIKDRRDIDQGTYELGNKTESNECMFFCMFFFVFLDQDGHRPRPHQKGYESWDGGAGDVEEEVVPEASSWCPSSLLSTTPPATTY